MIIYHRHLPSRLKRENDLTCEYYAVSASGGWKEHAFSRRRARQRGTDGQKKKWTDMSAMGGGRLINDLTKAGGD